MTSPTRKKRKPPLKRRIGTWVAYHGGIPAAYVLLRLLYRTWRIERIAEERNRIRPALIALWHGDLLTATQELPRLLPGLEVIASRSRDGSLVTRYVSMFGLGVIRGGSSKGGADALRQMRQSLDRGQLLIVPVDGPRGPRGQVKIGVAAMAVHTGLPVIPGVVVAERAWRFRSWDRAYIPKPFSRVRIIYGEPICARKEGGREEIEEMRARVEQALWEMHGENAPSVPSGK